MTATLHLTNKNFFCHQDVSIFVAFTGMPVVGAAIRLDAAHVDRLIRQLRKLPENERGFYEEWAEADFEKFTGDLFITAVAFVPDSRQDNLYDLHFEIGDYSELEESRIFGR